MRTSPYTRTKERLEMETAIKFLLALTIAVVTVDLTKPNFFVSLFEGFQTEHHASESFKPATDQREEFFNIEGIAERFNRPPARHEETIVNVVRPPRPTVTDASHLLWQNSYEPPRLYSPESYSLAQRYSLEELSKLTAERLRRYHVLLNDGATKDEVNKAYDDYIVYRNALAIKKGN